MGTVILQQLSGRFLAIWDLLWHLPLFWDALSALPLMWPSLGDTLAMPDLVMLQLLYLDGNFFPKKSLSQEVCRCFCGWRNFTKKWQKIFTLASNGIHYVFDFDILLFIIKIKR